MSSALKKLFKSSRPLPSEAGSNPNSWNEGHIDEENVTDPGSKDAAEVVNQVPWEGLPYGTEQHIQDGVKQAEALTMTLTKTSLGIAYTL